MRIGPAIAAFAVACVSVAAEMLVLLIRGGTCGASEGGGSCSAGFVDYALGASAGIAAVLFVALLLKRG